MAEPNTFVAPEVAVNAIVLAELTVIVPEPDAGLEDSAVSTVHVNVAVPVVPLLSNCSFPPDSCDDETGVSPVNSVPFKDHVP